MADQTTINSRMPLTIGPRDAKHLDCRKTPNDQCKMTPLHSAIRQDLDPSEEVTEVTPDATLD